MPTSRSTRAVLFGFQLDLIAIFGQVSFDGALSSLWTILFLFGLILSSVGYFERES